LARLHFFSFLSHSIASVTRSNHCEKTSVTGLRDFVYPAYVLALCDPDFELGSRRADVIAAIGASQNVEVRAFCHRARPILRDDRFAVSSG
jgi:hypothetical protein